MLTTGRVLRYEEGDVTLTSDAMIVRKRKADNVGVEDLRRAYFMDERRSVQYIYRLMKKPDDNHKGISDTIYCTYKRRSGK